jgi:hypothetical protein
VLDERRDGLGRGAAQKMSLRNETVDTVIRAIDTRRLAERDYSRHSCMAVKGRPGCIEITCLFGKHRHSTSQTNDRDANNILALVAF